MSIQKRADETLAEFGLRAFDMSDSVTAISLVTEQAKREALTDLRERCESAHVGLATIMLDDRTDGDVHRLKGKAQGVSLAIGYIDEALNALGGGN